MAPLRNLWEGGHKGEGGLPDIKDFAAHGQRPGFEKHIMSNALTEKALRQLGKKATPLHPHQKERAKGWDLYLSSQRHNFKVYKTPGMMSDLICERNVLSVIVCTKEAKTYVFGIVCEKSTYGIVAVDPCVSDEIKKMGCKYNTWMVATAVSSCKQLADLHICPTLSGCAVSFGVLLPLFGNGAAPKHTLVRSERYGVV